MWSWIRPEALVVAALAWSVGCDDSKCLRNSDCPVALECRAGACQLPLVQGDAGPQDLAGDAGAGGAQDASLGDRPLDSGVDERDAEPAARDAGEDAGTPEDAGQDDEDAGRAPDAGLEDAGGTDDDGGTDAG